MKICVAQLESVKEDIHNNIQKHLEQVKSAIHLDADLIIFPELSVTAYEPELASKFATSLENKIFDPFQVLSDKKGITIGIGMPTKESNELCISMLIFQPNAKRTYYSKQLLHSDELPYFVAGKKQMILNIKGLKVALGICYETLQNQHISEACQRGADIYIASVAKSKNGIKKAYKHFPKVANQFNIPILMSNSVGYCDTFMSSGESAVWSKTGKLIEQLDSQNQGLIIYDTELEQARAHQLKIEKGQLSDLEELVQIYVDAKSALDKKGIHQWTDDYPKRSIIENDLRNGFLYVLKYNNQLIGAIHISEEQEPEYKLVDWEFDQSKALVIHRLVVDPKHQKQAFGKQLMDFAEHFAEYNKYTSVRLDAYSQNEKVITFYKRRNYLIRGELNFPQRIYPFYCMEKEIR
ncbi:MAG: GNAT family N-acetyltransferase [Flavobacteriales bacterium]